MDINTAIDKVRLAQDLLDEVYREFQYTDQFELVSNLSMADTGCLESLVILQLLRVRNKE